MKKYLIKNKKNLIFSALSLVLMLLCWLVFWLVVKNEYVVPSFVQTLKQACALLCEAFFWQALLNTLLRVVLAFILSFILGAILAFLGTQFKFLNALLKPIVSVFRTVPTMAVILILLTWTSPRVAPVIITVLVLFPLIYTQINGAIGQIDQGVLQVAKVYNFSKKTTLTKIYLPLISPYILSQTGANLSFAIKLIISAEIMSYTFTSIGGIMQQASLYMQTSRLAALTLIAVLLGIVIEAIFAVIEKCAFKWNKREENYDRN